MATIECIINIAIYLALGVLALWLLDKYIELSRREWEDECREILREDKRRENAVWEITTRVNDDRADLFRNYSEMEVDV